MADLRPFRGIRYSAGAVPDLGVAVAPPYDVIPEEELTLHQGRSPYNAIRLTRPGADHAEAARVRDAWLAAGVIRQDETPGFYLHEHRFPGGTRRGLIGAVRLQPYSEGAVLPHELTHRGPKEDRLALYRATAMAFEPLWFTYQGASTALPKLLADGFSQPAELTFTFPAHEEHRLWHLTDPAWIAEVRSAFEGLPLLIADGHHRYETALAYAQEVGGDPDSSVHFALGLLVDLADPGLRVEPTHRVMRVAPVKVTGGEPAGSLAEVLESIRDRVAVGHYSAGKFQVLPLEGDLALVEVHRQIIDNMLGKRTAEEGLLYTRDAEEAVRWVDETRGQAAFFLPGPDLAAVLKLAQEGRTLPQKSTYFAPKPPTGMVFQNLADPTL